MELELTKKEYHILMNGLAYYLAFRNGKENRIKDEEIMDLSKRIMKEMLRKYPVERTNKQKLVITLNKKEGEQNDKH